MDDEERLSASSDGSEQDRDQDQEQDELMEDADADADMDDDNNDDDNADEDPDQDRNRDQYYADNGKDTSRGQSEAPDAKSGEDERPEVSSSPSGSIKKEASTAQDEATRASADAATRPESSSPAPPALAYMRPRVRPEAITARNYDIVPTMAAPQSTSINALSLTPDLRYWVTGGSDGYIRKYDGASTINGKLQLTVAQRHPFVDSVTKAGVLMSYWENEEPPAPGRGDQEHILSPVYSLALHSQALWLLSGLESGGINLQSVRHDEGKRIHCLQRHTNAVSVLTLAQDERSVLSGGWDKSIFDWDLNTGQIIRGFDGSGGQISAVELRPANGAPVPADADEPLPSNTISSNNGMPFTNGVFHSGLREAGQGQLDRSDPDGGGDAGEASPAHESLFGGSDAGSLFGDTAGEQPFGNDEDEYGSTMGMMSGHEGGMDHSADMAMAVMGGADEDGDKAQLQQGEGEGEGVGDTMEVDGTAPPLVDGVHPPALASEGLDQEKEGATEQPESGPQAFQADQKDAVDGESTAEALKRSQSPAILTHERPPQQFDPSQVSATTFMSTAIDGTIRIWDKRVLNPVARIATRPGVPPWCMGACWSPDGNTIYAGRRNSIVEEFDIYKAKRGWEPDRTLKFPPGSGAVSAVRAMPNGRHLVCASFDILRMYDLKDTRQSSKHSQPPFLVIPGNPRGGVTSCLYIDPTSRFMLTTAGTRGWEGTSTEVLVGYEIQPVADA